MTASLTPEAEAALRDHVRDTADKAGHPFCTDIASLLAMLDALRASLDPERPEAVAAWAVALQHIDPADLRLGRDLRPPATALLRARREAERP